MTQFKRNVTTIWVAFEPTIYFYHKILVFITMIYPEPPHSLFEGEEATNMPFVNATKKKELQTIRALHFNVIRIFIELLFQIASRRRLQRVPLFWHRLNQRKLSAHRIPALELSQALQPTSALAIC